MEIFGNKNYPREYISVLFMNGLLTDLPDRYKVNDSVFYSKCEKPVALTPAS